MGMSPRLLRPRQSGGATDADARTYIAAVQTADGATLEPAVVKAINDFVIGCKADGIWTAIKASCILMGARTLSGALTPLVGTAPTNTNFVSGDYNRKTGLLGNGTNKRISTGRNNTADSQNSKHMSVYYSTAASVDSVLLGYGGAGTGASNLTRSGTQMFFRLHNNGASGVAGTASSVGFVGSSRAASASYTARIAGADNTITATSQTPASGTIQVFADDGTLHTDARLAFYSIGEALTLSLLDTRVSALYTAIGAAIA